MHMGARLRPLLALLFLMIPRFLPTRGARECATPTTSARSGRWRSRPAVVQPDPYDLQPQEPPHLEISPRRGSARAHRRHIGDAAVQGTAVRALCGVFFVPRTDPTDLPYCEEYSRRYAQLPPF